MSDASHWSIFLNAALINNFVLAYFLGICPFFGVSARLETAVRMGGAVSFVMLVASVCAYSINLLLEVVGAPFLRIISYILVIASTVQLVEMLIRKLSPTNCAILGLALFQTNRNYDFTQAVSYALGAGAGFALALVLMAGVREKLDLADLPRLVQGTAAALIVAGILSMSFMGFAGLGR